MKILLQKVYRPSTELACTTFDAFVRSVQIGCKVSLARVDVDEVADADLTARLSGALGVQVGDDIFRTADVEVAVDAASESHAAIGGGHHENDESRPTSRVKRLVQTEVTSVVHHCKHIAADRTVQQSRGKYGKLSSQIENRLLSLCSAEP